MAEPQFLQTDRNYRTARMTATSLRSEWKIPSNQGATTQIIGLTVDQPADIEIESWTFHRILVHRSTSMWNSFPGIRLPITIDGDDEAVVRIYRAQGFTRGPVTLTMQLASSEWFHGEPDTSDIWSQTHTHKEAKHYQHPNEPSRYVRL